MLFKHLQRAMIIPYMRGWMGNAYHYCKMAKGRTIEQKQKFVENITKEAARTLNVKEEWVTVIFDEYDRETGLLTGNCIY